MVITIPGMRILSTANRREHHMAQRKRLTKMRADTHMMLLTKAKPGWDAFVVSLTRIAPANRGRLDKWDNLPNAFKATIDGTCDYLGIDDAEDDRLRVVFNDQEIGPWAARIEITEWDKSKCHECGHKLEER